MKYYLLIFFSLFSFLEAGITWQDGKIIDSELALTFNCEEHYRIASLAYERNDYNEARKHFQIVSENFPNAEYGINSLFFLGVCYYELHELDFANASLTEYIKRQSHPKHFEEAITYKFDIANQLRCGAKRRFFNSKRFPKWRSGDSLALRIYDEIIDTIPCHDFAAQSLFAKGYMLWQKQEYQESVDAYQTLIRRFPKHELSPLAYVAVNRVFLEQCRVEFQNPDLLQLAQINLKRFKQEYPRDENIEMAEQDVQAIKECYADGLYKTGCFYEKTCHPNASIIYYQNTIDLFPDTYVAELCRARIVCLTGSFPE